jgi:hypothetical protein
VNARPGEPYTTVVDVDVVVVVVLGIPVGGGTLVVEVLVVVDVAGLPVVGGTDDVVVTGWVVEVVDGGQSLCRGTHMSFRLSTSFLGFVPFGAFATSFSLSFPGFLPFFFVGIGMSTNDPVQEEPSGEDGTVMETLPFAWSRSSFDGALHARFGSFWFQQTRARSVQLRSPHGPASHASPSVQETFFPFVTPVAVMPLTSSST